MSRLGGNPDPKLVDNLLYRMIIQGANTITLKNILVGEVWICSGQSNMEWPVKRSKNAEQEIAGANFPQIRFFNVNHFMGATPKEDFAEGQWQVCTPENVSILKR